MKKMTLTSAVIIAASFPVLAQTIPEPPAWLEPVSFPASGQNICSPDSWKLVFWDNFSGNAIDTTKWITYKSWKGLQRPRPGDDPINWDHDDWGGARHEGKDGQGVSEKNIFRNENIVVSNGTAKLKIKHEPYSWKCPSCPESERQNVKYTGAALCTYYYYNGQQRSFNSGRFEFRARFPDFPHSFGTAWTWAGEHMGVNELDLAESNGANWSGNPKNDWLRWLHWQNYVGRIYHPTHAWGRLADEDRNLPPYPVPYHNDEDVRREDNPAHYPKQNWSNFIAGTMFDFTQWNTYTVEWDSTEVKTYLNHVLVDRLPKYYYKMPVGPFHIRVNAGCNANTKYQVTRGFPYSKNSGSQLRFTAGVKKDVQMDNSNNVYDLGEIELDYVGMWQRQPEPGYQEICKPSIIAPFLSITGNPQLCGSGNYQVSQFFPGGTWTANNNAVTFSGFSNFNTVATITENPNSPFREVIITYTYTPQGCPPQTANFHITTNNRQIPTVFCVAQNYFLKRNFTLKVHNPLPGAEYSWKVWYGILGPWEHSYQANGATIITPKIVHGFLPSYVVKWELTEKRCGITRKYEGMRDMFRYIPISFNQPLTYMTKDKSAIYLEARFSEADSIAYESEVADLIATKYIDDPADTPQITEIINDAYFERLEKYLYFTESETDTPGVQSISVNMSLTEAQVTKSSVYPNPVQSDLCHIVLSPAFNQIDAPPIRYRLIDLNQRVLFSGTLDLKQQTINLKHIQDNGIYVLELKQNNQLEYIKLHRLK